MLGFAPISSEPFDSDEAEEVFPSLPGSGGGDVSHPFSGVGFSSVRFVGPNDSMRRDGNVDINRSAPQGLRNNR